MSIESGLTPESLKSFLRDLEVLSLPKEKKKEILVRSLQMIKRQSVKTASHQKEPTGEAWKPRKNGTAKMLRRIAKLFNSKADLGFGNQGKLYYKNQRTGQIAEEHQYGLDHEFDVSDFKGGRTKDGQEPATKRQAQKLRDLGYRKAIGKKRKRLSIREIQQQLTRDQAGAIIRKMSTKGYVSKSLTRWIIPTEKRPFLDERANENARIVGEILQKYLEENGL
ncbi:hypothetical protein RO21_06060 [[Actinobacillus] muris]|uniref:Phage virion morphogenesis protein n=1 Tax=Muribacter muris TaxID=67855 RepID=A0A0J5P5D9_9PAST|nr:hypothetical protein [Muribacter muris]KMK51476.1 hypothetical protein RO21_06060 [[Actinobacillus] muris] [Muribacter muris]